MLRESSVAEHKHQVDQVRMNVEAVLKWSWEWKISISKKVKMQKQQLKANEWSLMVDCWALISLFWSVINSYINLETSAACTDLYFQFGSLELATIPYTMTSMEIFLWFPFLLLCVLHFCCFFEWTKKKQQNFIP